MRDYKKLEVWKKSHETYIFIKKNIVVKFPKEERFELTSQLNRAALSIPLNIVEGCGRFTDKDFARSRLLLFAAQELNYRITHLDRISLIAVRQTCHKSFYQFVPYAG